MIDTRFTFGKRTFSVHSDSSLSDINIVLSEVKNDIFIYKIKMRFADTAKESDAILSWEEPLDGITGFWAPCKNRGRHIPQWWYSQTVHSSLIEGAPLASLFSADSNNLHTFALSEAEKPFDFSLWLKNDPGKDSLHIQIRPFKNEAPTVSELSFFLRIDDRILPLADCVKDVSAWWQNFYPADKRKYSDSFAGDEPLFSSWYACFQAPEQQTLEKELPIISELGFKSMIIDDGWSYDGKGDGSYSYCGAWEVSEEKFPDMAAFVKKAHSFGIKIALWFPVPFVGERNPDYVKFKDKLLADTMGAGILDPRFPEVRDYIVYNYVNLLKKYGFDGLKLDFLTDFNRPAPHDRPGTDCDTINEAVTKLLSSIEKEVRSTDPDMLIEYREYYIGPSVTRHCNMLRVGDCAFDFITNRIGSVDLRMLNYPLAVHSDMLLWRKDETPENIAVMLLNVLFAVPQISVLTAEMEEEQRKVIANHLSYYSAHKDILLHGKMTVYEPQANYTVVSAEDDILRIAVVYSPRVYKFDGKTADVFNATEEDHIYIDTEETISVQCFDIFGNMTSEETISAPLAKIPVSKGRRVRISSLKRSV